MSKPCGSPGWPTPSRPCMFSRAENEVYRALDARDKRLGSQLLDAQRSLHQGARDGLSIRSIASMFPRPGDPPGFCAWRARPGTPVAGRFTASRPGRTDRSRRGAAGRPRVDLPGWRRVHSRGTVREYKLETSVRVTPPLDRPLNSRSAVQSARIWPIMGFMTWSCCLGRSISIRHCACISERGNPVAAFPQRPAGGVRPCRSTAG